MFLLLSRYLIPGVNAPYVLLTIPDALLVTTDMPSSGYHLFNEAYIMTAIDLNFHNQLLLDWINPAYMKMSE